MTRRAATRLAAAVPLASCALLAACAGSAPPPPPPVQAASIPAPPPPPPRPPAAPSSPDRLVVLFQPASAELSPQGQQGLDLGARLFRDGHPSVMFVAGHADPSGDEFANLELSARRARVVKQGLVERGIPAEMLEMQAFGASRPLVAPDPAAAENRSAVVTWR